MNKIRYMLSILIHDGLSRLKDSLLAFLQLNVAYSKHAYGKRNAPNEQTPGASRKPISLNQNRILKVL